MRENQGFILACCLLCFYALLQLPEGRYGTSIGGAIPVLLSTTLAAILGFTALFRCLRRTDLPIKQRLIPFCFWAGSLGLAILFNTWLNRVDYAENFMCVSTSSDSIMAGYDFKEDGCYKYWDGSPLGVFYNYGTYERRDSVITLHSEIRNAPLETHLIIRPYFPAANPSFNAKSVLIAHDKSGDAINDNNAYYIRELNSNN